MDQHIGFCGVDGGRIAYATVGDGPPLVLPAWWVSHVEEDWQDPLFRAFITALGAHHTVVRYDRLGTGLSDRERPPAQYTIEAEVGAVAALYDELGLDAAALLAVSCGGCIAASFADRHPERVAALVFYGSYGYGPEIAPADVQRLMIAAVRTNWGMASRLLTDVFLPGAAEEERSEFARFQRASATPEMAAELLELVYAADVRELLPRLSAPTLVVHRRGDRAVRFQHGRDLASRIPGARFVPLEGRAHVPWAGNVGAVVQPIVRFLGSGEAGDAPVDSDGVLSDREREVLRMVASGLNDNQIAEALVLSPHTVHRHVANIRTKLRQPTRGAAAAEAARLRLI